MRSFAIFGILIVAAPVFAQNGFSATYDSTRQVTLKGPVTRIEWTNPHAFILVNVQDALGVLTSWAVEIGNPLDLEKDGMFHKTERISRPNLRTLSYEAIIDDPGAYTNPWSAQRTITQTTASKWIPGGEMFEYICQDDAR